MTVCELCNGRGWVVLLGQGNGSARRCECYTSRPIETRLREAGVGEDLIGASWDTWEGARPDLGGWPESAVCLTLAGKTRRGKSHIAAAIAREWIKSGLRVKFIEVTELLEELKGRFGEGAQPDLLPQITSPDLLILDDAYAHQETRWADSMVSRWIRARFREQKALIVTTNLGLLEIEQIEPRLRSRLESSVFLPLVGKEFRKAPRAPG